MSNPRGPMVPHEIREAMDRSRIFDHCANAMATLGRILRQPDNPYYTREVIEQAVVEAESTIQRASIEIRKMKDEPPQSRTS